MQKNLLGIGLIAVGSYLLYTYMKKKQDQANQTDQDQDQDQDQTDQTDQTAEVPSETNLTKADFGTRWRSDLSGREIFANEIRSMNNFEIV
jgi:hypothetical protein